MNLNTPASASTISVNFQDNAAYPKANGCDWSTNNWEMKTRGIEKDLTTRATTL
jgi:hypothetical protein